MLKIYTAPDGSTWQYEEGEQPSNYVEAAPAAKTKEAKPANKAAKVANKGA